MNDFSGENSTTQNGPPPYAPRAADGAQPVYSEAGPGPSVNGPGAPIPAGPVQSGPGPSASPSPSPGQAPGQAPGPMQGQGPAPAQANGGPQRSAMVKGRIDVADEVVEKVAALAAIEVEGVADLGGDFARALESVRERIGIGQKRGDQGVKAEISGRDVAVSVTIVIEYGHVVMEVARNVQANVAIQTHRMLGLRVVEVNVNVDDVKMPQPARADDEYDDTDGFVPLEG